MLRGQQLSSPRCTDDIPRTPPRDTTNRALLQTPLQCLALDQYFLSPPCSYAKSIGILEFTRPADLNVSMLPGRRSAAFARLPAARQRASTTFMKPLIYIRLQTSTLHPSCFRQAIHISIAQQFRTLHTSAQPKRSVRFQVNVVKRKLHADLVHVRKPVSGQRKKITATAVNLGPPQFLHEGCNPESSPRAFPC